MRRALVVRHFDNQIRSHSESSLLYDCRPSGSASVPGRSSRIPQTEVQSSG